MENENVHTAAAALNRAGLVSINPPPFFIEEICPSMRAANAALKSFRINPSCPVRRRRIALTLGRVARALNWFAAVRRGGLPPDQAAELEDIAKQLSAAAALNLNTSSHA
jgi:hypothetical protein